MLSVIIPTEGVERTAVATLAALVPGAAAGVIREVLLVDRVSNGVIERVADVAGCHYLHFEGSRAAAMAEGARPQTLHVTIGADGKFAYSSEAAAPAAEAVSA